MDTTTSSLSIVSMCDPCSQALFPSPCKSSSFYRHIASPATSGDSLPKFLSAVTLPRHLWSLLGLESCVSPFSNHVAARVLSLGTRKTTLCPELFSSPENAHLLTCYPPRLLDLGYPFLCLFNYSSLVYPTVYYCGSVTIGLMVFWPLVSKASVSCTM